MNIQAVANRTGVPSATLRKWEQRYRVLAPERTVGAHRRYSERDVARVEWLKARLAEGYRIGEAARLLGGDSATVASDPAELADALVSAAREGDVARISHALDQAFRLLPREHAVLHVAEPALKRVGELWAAGELRVADEHAVSELTRGKVRALLDGAVAGPRGRIVLCCVPGERHELGLLMLAALLHADGWAVLYLGADTPLREALALAQANGARALCVSATLAESARAAEPDLAEIEASGLPLLRGGNAYGGEPAGAAVHRVRLLAESAVPD